MVDYQKYLDAQKAAALASSRGFSGGDEAYLAAMNADPNHTAEALKVANGGAAEDDGPSIFSRLASLLSGESRKVLDSVGPRAGTAMAGLSRYGGGASPIAQAYNQWLANRQAREQSLLSMANNTAITRGYETAEKEVAARQQYMQLASQMATATPTQREVLIEQMNAIKGQFPGVDFGNLSERMAEAYDMDKEQQVAQNVAYGNLFAKYVKPGDLDETGRAAALAEADEAYKDGQINAEQYVQIRNNILGVRDLAAEANKKTKEAYQDLYRGEGVKKAGRKIEEKNEKEAFAKISVAADRAEAYRKAKDESTVAKEGITFTYKLKDGKPVIVGPSGVVYKVYEVE